MAIINNPLISIIVPIYNSEKYLERCIKSIISQTYTNIEIILVNDGSNDLSLSICKELETNDNRIIIIDIPNAGVSNARNTGLQASKGDYIQFLDSDDYMLENYIETLYNNMSANNSDMVVCSIKVLDNNLNELGYRDAENHVFKLNEPNKDVLFNFFDRFLVFGPVNKLFKKSILSKNNIIYDTSISYGEDLLLNLEYLKHCKKISFTNKVYWPYIQDNTNSLSNKRRSDKIDIVKKLHDAIIDFLNRINSYTPAFKTLLNQRMFDYSYNEAFAIARDKNLSFSEKRSNLKKLLYDNDVKNTYNYIAPNKYSKLTVFLMKNKLVSLFILKYK